MSKLSPKYLEYLPNLTVGDTIIAFDPGTTTGYAVGRYAGALAFELVDVGEIYWQSRFQYITVLFEQHKPQHIVMEDFRLYEREARNQINSHFPSVLVIGQVQQLAYSLGMIDKMNYAMAAAIGMYTVLDADQEKFNQGSEHMKDAYKHLRRFVTQCWSKHNSTAEKLGKMVW